MTNWREITGYEGSYEVSDSGDVRSLDRVVEYRTGRRVPLKGVTLSPALSKCGHLKVSLTQHNQAETRLVHQLVAEAFIGPRPDGLEVRHLNGIGTDNRVENLAYGTHQQNVRDRNRHGTCPQLLKTHCPQGHPYDEANTYRKPSKPDRRICLICRRNADRVSQQRRRDAMRSVA
jgi:hypothetical protein